MRQMVAPEAKPERTTTLGELLGGFFRRAGDEESRIFYGYHKPGIGLLYSQVFEDGKVSKAPSEIINQAATIEVISQEDLGIDRVYWA